MVAQIKNQAKESASFITFSNSLLLFKELFLISHFNIFKRKKKIAGSLKSLEHVRIPGL